MLLPDATVARTSGLVESEIDDEIVALNIESGMCYGLNRMASRIWEMLAKPIRVRDLCETLIAEYDVEPDQCKQDVLELLKELENERLIVVTNAP